MAICVICWGRAAKAEFGESKMKYEFCQVEMPDGYERCPACLAAAGSRLNPGQLLAGRFRLVRLIGSGGLVDVWLAEDEHLDHEPVACKVLKWDLNNNRLALADLKREVLLTRKLRHPNILPAHSFWVSGDIYFITRDYVDGKSLSECLAELGRPYALAEILPWIRGLCAALDYAHAEGVLHRDVKPANVLVRSNGSVQLTDFGIARTVVDAESQGGDEMTQGTLLFMSPEQLTGEALDTRSDLYSLASTVYELLNGAPPFFGGDVPAQIQLKSAPSIPHLGLEANRVLLKALSKRPAQRHATCLEFFRDIEAASLSAGRRPTPTAPVMDLEGLAATVALPTGPAETQPERLGRMLLDTHVITNEQLDAALEEQRGGGERLGDILVKLGIVPEGAIAAVVGHQLRLPMLEEGAAPDRALLDMIGPASARALGCVPIGRSASGIRVAIADPLDWPSINRIEEIFAEPVEMCVATPTEIRALLDTAGAT